jgi:Bax protein
MQPQPKFKLIAVALLIYALATLALTLFLANSQYAPRAADGISGSTQLPDMSAITHIPERKQTFIQLLAPMVAQKNRALLHQRQQLLAMRDDLARGNRLSHVQSHLLARLQQHYKLQTNGKTEPAKPNSNPKPILTLLKRVDIIPASMVIAQAAAESGWGTSRFARQAQNLFGQWCYRKGCGLVPKRRNKGAQHEVQKFASVEQAVNAYYRNINTHRAYRGVRQRRAALREAGKAITGLALIPGLSQYSSRGQVYVDEIAELIRYNKLSALDKNPTAAAPNN